MVQNDIQLYVLHVLNSSNVNLPQILGSKWDTDQGGKKIFFEEDLAYCFELYINPFVDQYLTNGECKKKVLGKSINAQFLTFVNKIAWA